MEKIEKIQALSKGDEVRDQINFKTPKKFFLRNEQNNTDNDEISNGGKNFQSKISFKFLDKENYDQKLINSLLVRI